MKAPLIELHDVAVRLNGQAILSGLNWRLRPGEHWAVLGGNGAGKSTFLRLLRGEVWPAPGPGVRIYHFDGVSQRTAVGVKERIALVSPESHDRYLQLDWKRPARDVVLSGITGGDYLYNRPAATQRANAVDAVALLGIESLLERDVQELSTGELRKVLIARALAGRPSVLLLDEVCDGLDAPSRAKLLHALDRIARSGTQLVYTTHRPEELLPSITHALILEAGAITWQGAAAKLPPSTPPSRLEDDPNPFSAWRCNDSTNHDSTPSPSTSRPVCAPTLIRIANADVYLNRKRVLRDIHWRMDAGQNWAVFGANGAGKSTFLQLVAGDIHPATGSLVNRFNLTNRDSLWDLRKRIGYLSPRLQAVYREPLRASELVASGFFSSIGLLDKVTRSQRARVRQLFDTFRLGDLAPRSVLELSYGEIRKLLLLRALVHRPRILICDEPFDGLDAGAKTAFAAALDEVSRNGTRLITVTHHLDDLPACITHALVLENGVVACQGELADVRHHAAMKRLFGG